NRGTNAIESSNDFNDFIFAGQAPPERRFGAPGLQILDEISIERCLLFVRRAIMSTCADLRIAAFVCAGANANVHRQRGHVWSMVFHRYYLADRGSSCAFAPHWQGAGLVLAGPKQHKTNNTPTLGSGGDDIPIFPRHNSARSDYLFGSRFLGRRYTAHHWRPHQ